VVNEGYTQETLSGVYVAPQNDETLKKEKLCKEKEGRKTRNM